MRLMIQTDAAWEANQVCWNAARGLACWACLFFFLSPLCTYWMDASGISKSPRPTSWLHHTHRHAHSFFKVAEIILISPFRYYHISIFHQIKRENSSRRDLLSGSLKCAHLHYEWQIIHTQTHTPECPIVLGDPLTNLSFNQILPTIH